MSLEKRIKGFVQLGLFLKQFESGDKTETLNEINDYFYDGFEDLILRQKSYNGWFDKDNVLNSISEIANSLSEENLMNWISEYSIIDDPKKTIGVIMAGNIPLVGFHDFLSVLITGNTIQAKLASGDNTLIRRVGEILIKIEPLFKSKIEFVERLESFDAVIATGSNNTARYFEQYFGKYPHIIRKNRSSVAIINEDDKLEDIKPLGKDIFQYYGLGCRSVSKLYFPKGYKIDTFFESILDDYQDVTQNNKYANNYDYNKAVYLMGSNQLLDNGFLLLKEETSFVSPVGVINYEFYSSIEDLDRHLRVNKGELQCIVSSNNSPLESLRFGEAQCPSLDSYADGVDTVAFILGLQ
ncbi:acyl-CoA reductase [Vicingaceae bacterium]|nr:acyl-CoA reductase [Vicingaceae bacterium]